MKWFFRKKRDPQDMFLIALTEVLESNDDDFIKEVYERHARLVNARSEVREFLKTIRG